MSVKERKPVTPFYVVALLWLLSGAFLPLYQPHHYAILAAVSGAVFFLVYALCRSGGILGGETQAPPQSREDQPAPGGNPELEEMLRSGEAALAEMKRLNDSIAAPGISADISQLEQLSANIFQAVRDDPSKLPQIRRFMDYYLPTVLKLLRSYDRMDDAGVSDGNIGGTLVRIETIMHNVVIAFRKQLDGLYGAEALDISADIKVLETMMAREGLSGQELNADPSRPGGTDIRLEL